MTGPISNTTAQDQIQYLQHLANTPGVDTEQQAFAKGILEQLQNVPPAEAAESLSEIFGIAPGSNLTTEQIRSRMDTVIASYERIAEGSTVSSNSYLTPASAAKLLAKLAVELSFEQQENARDQALAARDMRVASLENAAGKMREEADSLRSQAGKQLALGIASGLVQIGGGAYGMRAGVKGAQATNMQHNMQAGDLALNKTNIDKMTDLSKIAGKGEGAIAMTRGTAAAADAGSGAAGSIEGGVQADLRADAKDEETQAEFQRTTQDLANEFARSTREHASNMIDAALRLQQAEVEAHRAAARV